MSRYLRKSSPHAIGLEIGTSSIKVAALQAGSGALQHAVMTPTPANAMRDGGVVEPQAIANEIRGLLGANGITTKHVVTAIPNQAAITRNIMVPRMEAKELAEAIRWEAERYIPFPIDEVTLDYSLLDNPDAVAADAQMEVVIAAVPNDVVNRHIETLRLAGLEPVVVDIKSFAAMRALQGQAQGGPDEVTLVLEIGASSSVIGLMRGDRLLLSRNINLAADDFTMALQKQFDLDFNAAENVKLNYVVPVSGNLPPTDDRQPYSAARVAEAVRPVLIDLITEVRRSLEFYRVQSGELVIDRMLLAGGGAKLNGLAGAMGEALGIPTEIGNPWLAVNSEQAAADSGFLSDHAPEFAVPLGLAMRGVGRG